MTRRTRRISLFLSLASISTGCQSNSGPAIERWSEAVRLTSQPDLNTDAETAAALQMSDRADGELARCLTAIDYARDAAIHNITNAETTGYKASVIRCMGGNKLSCHVDCTQGSLENTDRPLDIGIQGQGFLKVQVQDSIGNGFGYTRNGRLVVNEVGELVVGPGLGHKLIPSVRIPLNSTDVTIGPDGIISVLVAGQTAKQEVGSIKLTHFLNPEALNREGDTLFTETEASGPPADDVPGQGGAGQILQGFLESSNVDVKWESLHRLRFLDQWRDTLLHAAGDADPKTIHASRPSAHKAGSAEMQPLLDQPMSQAEIGRIETLLSQNSIDYVVSNDRILVPSDRRIEVLSILSFNDALTNKTDTGSDGDATTEVLRAAEKMYAKKVIDTLADIPGVLVSVKVKLDNQPTGQQARADRKRTPQIESEGANARGGASMLPLEPVHPAPNTTIALPLAALSGETPGLPDTGEKTEYINLPVVSTYARSDLAAKATPFAVSVRIPQSFIVLVARNLADGKEPDAATLEQIRNDERIRIATVAARVLGLQNRSDASVEFYDDSARSVHEARTAEVLQASDRVTGKLADAIAVIGNAREVVVNNMANADAPGFKSTRAAKLDSGKLCCEIDFSQGTLEATSRPLDVAIQGEGFYKVNYAGAGGSGVAFTRCGALTMSRTGELAVSTGDEFRVMPSITFSPHAVDLSIAADGSIKALLPGRSTMSDVGHLHLWKFAHPERLKRQDAIFFTETPGSGGSIESTPGHDGIGQLRQGFLEESNVDINREWFRIRFLDKRRADMLHRENELH